MLDHTNFLTELKQLIESNNLISVYGKAGTGKTSLSLFLVGSFMTNEHPFYQQCVWIQASERFPIRRIAQFFQREPEKFQYIRNNIFITPLERPYRSYQEQSKFFNKIEQKIFPPDVKYMVIDNLSHHLRYEIAQYQNISDKVAILNKFYETQLLPFILFAQRNHITPILIHEVSYNPQLDQIVPFFHSLYNRIQSITFKLEKDSFTKENQLSISYKGQIIKVNYYIQTDGFYFQP